MKVINLFGGPGSGKSSTAYGLSHKLKYLGVNMEYVSEQAKSFTWEARHRTLKCQPYVTAKQFRDLWRLKNQVDVAVTDSPLLLGMVYGMDDGWPPSYYQWVMDQFRTFDNLNFFLVRNKPYLKSGRNQSEEEARQIDFEISKMLLDTATPHIIIRGGKDEHDTVNEIFGHIHANIPSLSIVPKVYGK